MRPHVCINENRVKLIWAENKSRFLCNFMRAHFVVVYSSSSYFFGRVERSHNYIFFEERFLIDLDFLAREPLPPPLMKILM